MSLEGEFPPGTPICVRQEVRCFGQAISPEIYGTVVDWQDLPTGSWFVHGPNDRLWLKRLRLRKVDGEITMLVIDDQTGLARLEPAGGPDSGKK